MLCLWVLCHFAHDKHTNAWIRLERYNKLNFDRNVKLSLPDGKCRWLSHLIKNNAENVTNQNFIYFAVGFSVISLMINIPMLEFAWKTYNKLNFDRNVKLSLADQKCRWLSHLPVIKNNAENVTQTKIIYIPPYWVLCHFAHEKLTRAWNSLGKHATNSKLTEMVNYSLQIASVTDCLTKKQLR